MGVFIDSVIVSLEKNVGSYVPNDLPNYNNKEVENLTIVYQLSDG